MRLKTAKANSVEDQPSDRKCKDEIVARTKLATDALNLSKINKDSNSVKCEKIVKEMKEPTMRSVLGRSFWFMLTAAINFPGVSIHRDCAWLKR